MKEKTKIGFLIGRFQPLHQGHVALINKILLDETLHELVVILGSSNTASTIKNPWSVAERIQQFKDSGILDSRINFRWVNDYIYSDLQWVSDIEAIMHSYKEHERVLFGHHKEGNDYLSWFPGVKFKNIDTGISMNATEIRKSLFDVGIAPIHAQEDWDYYKNETLRFSGYPYPETLNFLCADSLVVCSGNVLLINRKHAPGRDSWALPGGFKNRDETLQECSIRELREETNLKVPNKVLLGSIKASRVFDSPKRSEGIPRITQVFHYEIKENPDGTLPKANGSDDASAAVWVPVWKILQGEYVMFQDHLSIITTMLGVSLRRA